MRRWLSSYDYTRAEQQLWRGSRPRRGRRGLGECAHPFPGLAARNA